MEPIQYLEITSSRRNRNTDPLPSSFEAPISQSGQKLGLNALDPVCLSTSELQWKSNTFNARQSATNPNELLVQVENVTISGSGTQTIGNSSSTYSLIVNTITTPATSGRGSLHTISNYYVGAVAGVGDGKTVSTDRRRIIEYKYLGNDKAQMIFESPFTSTITPGTTQLYIVDPSTVDAITYAYPYLFVPNSRNIPNVYNNYRIYNVTRRQSRSILSYDYIYHLIEINTQETNVSTPTTGPITGWTTQDVYCLRKEDPLPLVSIFTDISNNATTFSSFNLILSDANSILNYIDNIPGSFLEIEMAQDVGALILQVPSNATQVTLRAGSNPDDGYYNGSFIRMLSGPAAGQITNIFNYNGTTKLATLDPGFTTSPNAGDAYDLSLNQESRKITKYVDYRDNATGGSLTTVNFPINNSVNRDPVYKNGYYNNLFIRVGIDIRTIVNYEVILNPLTLRPESAIVQIDPSFPFGAPVVSGTPFTITSGTVTSGTESFTHSISVQPATILPFSYDNLAPLNNSQSNNGNFVGQTYQAELLNLILPNQILNSGFGGLISYYQYVYVTLENTVGSGLNAQNNIISNNPRSTSTTFRATIDDISHPNTSTFVKIDGDGMSQIITFSPQHPIKFSVYMSNGSNPNRKEFFKVKIEDFYSPSPPNPIVQISAMFALRQVITNEQVLNKNSIT